MPGLPLLHHPIGEALFPLRRTSLVVPLIFHHYQAVRRSFAQRLGIKAGAGTTDLILDMRPDMLRRSERPGLAAGIGEKFREFGTVRALTADAALMDPILRDSKGPSRWPALYGRRRFFGRGRARGEESKFHTILG